MPQLDWDEIDFLECLEVIPEVEEYETKHVYEVHRDGLSLLLLVKQLDSTVQFSLRQQQVKAPLLKLALFVRGRVRYVNDKRGTYLEFADAVTVMPFTPFRYASVNELSDKTKFPQSWTVQLQVKPHIQIRYNMD